MLIKRPWFDEPAPSEVTSEAIYQQRRQFMGQGVGLATGLSLSAWSAVAAPTTPVGKLWSPQPLAAQPSAYSTKEKLTSYTDVTSYNNFYEFGTDKSAPAALAPKRLLVQPWTVRVEGLVKKPFILSLEELYKLAPLQERIYRLRCVEGWSMVIPWIGYSLSALIARAQPLGSAKYVQFISLADPKQMPEVSSRILNWPYSEGLRLDEAMHPLTLLALGLYGKTLPPQNGAPVRIVVPWKYGFKSAKSIVTIRFTEKQPPTAWNDSAANEYGFYSNVNPEVDHPRWSQATERRLGEASIFRPRRETLMFNGYADQVAGLYKGMDLRKFY